MAGIGFSLDGALIASAGTSDGSIQLWDVESCTRRGPVLLQETAAVARVVFSEDGSLVAGIGTDRPDIRVWDVAGRRPAADLGRLRPVRPSRRWRPRREGPRMAVGGGRNRVVAGTILR